jgi:Leucine-rich repeat (LRR) protein
MWQLMSASAAKVLAMNVRAYAKLVAVGLFLAMLTGCPETVFIADKALDSAIRAELHKPFGILTRADLLGVQALDARGLNIRNLSGIEHCLNLQWLDLRENDISNLKPLEQLGRPESPFDSPLVYLNLNGNVVTDIAPLVGLMNLQTLMLFGNQIPDIQALVTNAQYGGLGEGDVVVLDYDHLSTDALTVDIPLLESYGVRVLEAIPD